MSGRSLLLSPLQRQIPFHKVFDLFDKIVGYSQPPPPPGGNYSAIGTRGLSAASNSARIALYAVWPFFFAVSTTECKSRKASAPKSDLKPPPRVLQFYLQLPYATFAGIVVWGYQGVFKKGEDVVSAFDENLSKTFKRLLEPIKILLKQCVKTLEQRCLVDDIFRPLVPFVNGFLQQFLDGFGPALLLQFFGQAFTTSDISVIICFIDTKVRKTFDMNKGNAY